MNEQQGDKIISLLQLLLEENKKTNILLEDVKNLFQKYDMEVLLEDENLRDE